MTLPQRIRAGCDGTLPAALEAKYQLCDSAFVRVATREWRHFLKLRTLCHSAFVRVATPNMPQKPIWDIALPQRIRAGCDRYLTWIVRIAPTLPQRIRAGCDDPELLLMYILFTLPQRIRAGCDQCANNLRQPDGALPQRIRAGCDPFCEGGNKNEGSLPQRIRAGCDFADSNTAHCTRALPQRIRAGCDIARIGINKHGELCHSAFARVATAEKQCSALRICCEKVDSFSSVGESGLALTIFPFSFAAKATYVAINDSFGRAIDRFFGANRTGISVSYDFAEHPCL